MPLNQEIVNKIKDLFDKTKNHDCPYCDYEGHDSYTRSINHIINYVLAEEVKEIKDVLSQLCKEGFLYDIWAWEEREVPHYKLIEKSNL